MAQIFYSRPPTRPNSRDPEFWPRIGSRSRMAVGQAKPGRVTRDQISEIFENFEQKSANFEKIRENFSAQKVLRSRLKIVLRHFEHFFGPENFQ